MTHAGGKPHANVGDRSQRYEIRATGYPKQGESVIGWSNDIDGAEKMASAIRKAPGCICIVIFDRQEGRGIMIKVVITNEEIAGTYFAQEIIASKLRAAGIPMASNQLRPTKGTLLRVDDPDNHRIIYTWRQ